MLPAIRSAKKGIYFTLEAVIALLAITVGFGIILYLFVVMSKPPISVVQTELYDTVELFQMPIQDINGTCGPAGEGVTYGNITDITNPFITQLGEIYYRYAEQDCVDCGALISRCIQEFVDTRNMEDKNLQIRIEGTSFYRNGTIEQENATVLLPFKLLLFGTENNTRMWGPYVGEIRVWQ